MSAHYRIRSIPTPPEAVMFGKTSITDGVYVDTRGRAWLGEVQDYYRAQDGKREIAVMPHVQDGDTYIPAPDHWRDLVIAELPGILR